MKRMFFLMVFLISISVIHSFAQEICNNGIDDDGDGFIDCYDNNCAVSTFCKDFYLGDDATCEATPPAFPQFTMELDFASPNETTNHLARMAIGDLDRDGIPEIITMNRYTDRVFILNGNDGSIKVQKSVTWDPQWEIAIANLDNDNCAEIFFFGVEGGNVYIYSMDCNLNQNWRARVPDDPINYGLADFDGDGLIELYAKDAIFDAHTGTRIIQSANWNTLNGGPVAVDMMGDADLELVIGGIIYDVNLGARTADSGTLTELKKMPDYFIRNIFNATSVADYNQDGFLDVLASGSTKDGSAGNPRNTTIFFWDVQNDVVKTFFDNTAGAYLPNGWKNGTGRLNIADLDGDGQLNVSYVSGKFLYALDENLNLFWRVVINEETSGYTGCTLFDFNGDGKSEIVYRDEQFLYIIDGTTGSVYNQQSCISRTNREYPIVADVDADGSTELCVTCGFDDDEAWDEFDDLSFSRYSHVRVFKSASDPWVPARRLWNQHGYFNVNVNDDLTIPRRQQKHHLVFSTGSCTVGPNRPLNNFLNQSPFLNRDGCPTYKSPDLAHVPNTLTVDEPTCPETDFTVSFQITNQGDIALSGNVPITFYNGDPTQVGATKLNTITVPLNNFDVDAVHTVSNVTVTGPGSPFTLYIVLNDNGSTVPTPISLPNTNFLECDYGNNIISTPVNPLPVALTALKVQDNIKCVGSTTPDNGAVRAFIPTGGGGENIADYNFYWSIGAVAKPTGSADHVGASYTGLPGGTYTVYAIHKTANCSSDTVSVIVDQIDNFITAEIQVISEVTDCKNPNGHLDARVPKQGSPGQYEPFGKYDFIWYEGNDIFTSPEVSFSHTATGLKAVTYTVLVTEKSTGCQVIESYTVQDLTVPPVPTTSTVDIICSNANSGSISADVGGTTAGFSFRWYIGNNVKPTADFTTATVNNRPAGNYTLVVEDNSSKCESVPVTVTVGQTAPPVASASVTANMTSCDMSQPNGSVTSGGAGGSGTYTFEWFEGQNTLPANSISTSNSVSSLDAGVYTVKVTDATTGCFDTEEVTVAFAVVNPSIVIGAVANATTCTSPNGSVTVNVTLDNPSDYTFSWYDGPDVKPAPDYTDTDNVLENLAPGEYTVKAIHNTKHCEAAPVTATVLDNTPIIDITLNAGVTVFPSDCNSNDGVMQVNISAPGNVAGFDVQWFLGRAPFSGSAIKTDNGVTTSSASGLSTGVYTVVATNRDNGCQAFEEFDLPYLNAHSMELITKVDVDKCSPTDIGSITVQLNIPVFVGINESDYDIEMYAGTNDTGVPLTSFAGTNGTNQYTFPGLEPGFYTFVAITTNPVLTVGCRSVPITVEIEQITTDPVIVASQIDANMNCTGITANGRIELDIDGGASPNDYTFVWYEGPDTASPLLGTGTTGTTAGSINGEIARDLPPGTYTVEVTNITPVSTNCSSTATFTIFNNPPIVTIASGDIAITPHTRCDINTGSATISAINENGSPVAVAGYTFLWFDENLNLLPNAVTPETSSSITDLPVGRYFVQATSLTTNCASTMLEFEIEDMTMGSPTVDLVSFVSPTQCLKPTNIQGELHVNATGNSMSGYTYNWYLGPAVVGVPFFTGPDLTGITVPPGQTDITYTVEVINNTNFCSTTDTYTLPLIVAPITITASAAPLTFCSADNGIVFATVTSGSSNEYNYSWSTSTVPNAYSGQQVNNLPADDYTVIATDQMDAACVTAPVTVTIDDERVTPLVAATQISPLTNCDPTIPNGVADASVDGDIVNYTFDWYVGPAVAGAPFFTGADVGGLAAGIYTVQATDIITGCTGNTQVTITDEPIPVPLPQIEVLSHVTSCLTPNGALAASVNGNTKDYIFNWYIGSAVKPAPDFTGEIFSDLDVGIYIVTATSRITGCVSAPVNGEILDDPKYPDFDFRILPATCDLDNGFVSIFMTNNVDIDRIEWNINGTTVLGPNVYDVPAGIYSVTVTSTMGCPTTKDVEVKTEIRPFNGISRNRDDRNEYFHIDCIESFPGNHVQIFNRAGTLVYEVSNYDNIDIYFDGKSNRGINVMGNNLPDGTYFFIIDKGNGDKPLAGYLEIVN